MEFNRHQACEGQHAYLGASTYHWINYDEEKLAASYKKRLATLKGTLLHEYACNAIKLKIKQKSTPKTLNMYINDAIGFKMSPETVLYYSPNCFGTADAISFKDNFLRIHDLKTGEVPAHIEQLMIYAALFCLEYKKRPGEIQIELRIYQNNQIIYHVPEPEDIAHIMDKIISFDKIINRIDEEEK